MCLRERGCKGQLHARADNYPAYNINALRTILREVADKVEDKMKYEIATKDLNVFG